MLALSSRSCLHADIGILPQSTTVLTHTHRAVSVAVASVVARCRMTDGNMKGGGGGVQPKQALNFQVELLQ